MRLLFYLVLLPALLPVFLILWYVYSKDKQEREPLSAVMITFALGALFSFVDVPIERLLQSLLFARYGVADVRYELAENYLGVALVEELTKWAVIMVYVWKLRDFDWRYDGIVYSVCASLGFAGMENIMYVLTYGTGVSVSRALFAIPGHAAFGVFMGFFVARAKHWELRGSGFLRAACLLLSVAVPVAVHGTYDFLLSPAAVEMQYSSHFTAFVIVLDAAAWLMIRHEFKTDRPLGA